MIKTIMNKETVFLRQAEPRDISAIKQLLDYSYRAAEGWTHEADLVGGIRTTDAEIAAAAAERFPSTSPGRQWRGHRQFRRRRNVP